MRDKSVQSTAHKTYVNSGLFTLKILVNYTTDILTLLAFGIHNTVTSPVKRRSKVVLCKNGGSRSAREISILHFSKSISVFMRKYDACTTSKSVKKKLKNQKVLIFSTEHE